MTAALKTRLDGLVAAKMITAAQEQKILSRSSARLSKRINAKGVPFRRALRLPHGVPVLPAPPSSPRGLTLPAPPSGLRGLTPPAPPSTPRGIAVPAPSA
jgi:hypothetical protein